MTVMVREAAAPERQMTYDSTQNDFLGSERLDLKSGRPESGSWRSVGSERPELGSGRLVLGSEELEFGSKRPDLGSVRLDSGSEELDLGSERPDLVSYQSD